jgi:hypothetical protein
MRKRLRDDEDFNDQHDAEAIDKDLLDANKYDFIDTEDGGMQIIRKDESSKLHSDYLKHDANLAEIIDETILTRIAGELVEAVDADDRSREGWKVNMAEGLKLLGTKIDEPDELPFKYASTVYSPVLLQTLLEFTSSAKIELLPPSGPVKVNIYSDEYPDLVAKAKRKERFGNYYLLQEDKGFYPDTEQALMWCGLFGSVFKKIFYDPIMGKPVSRYIDPQDIIINNKESSPETANRITERSTLWDFEVKIYQEKGIFRSDIDIVPTTYEEQESIIDTAKNDMAGLSNSDSLNEIDKLYTFYNVHTKINLALKGFKDPLARVGIPSPYIIVIEKISQQVVAMYRDWTKDDPNFLPGEEFVHYYYMPGLGLYGYGFVHLAGNNTKAATQITRQLINAGMLNNHPGGFISGTIKTENPEIRIGPTEFVRIELGVLDDINKAISPLPYKEPSLVLKQLKDDLEDNVMSLNAAANRVPEFNSNAPVGTTYALLEELKKQQTAIIQRLHFALGREFKLLFDLFGKYMPEDRYPFKIEGAEHVVFAEDFTDNNDIVPVSDPNIISSAQRLIGAEIILKTALENSDVIDKRYALERYFKELKLTSSTIDKLFLPSQQDAIPLDPVTENQNNRNQLPLKTGIWQDHASHIITHQFDLMNLQNDQEPDQAAIASLSAHIKAHETDIYMLQMQHTMGIEMPEDPSKLKPKQQNKLAAMAAQASEILMQQMQQNQPPPPIDPTQVMMEDLQIKREGQQMRQQESAAKLQLEEVKFQQKAQFDQMKLENEQMKIQQQSQLKEMELQHKTQMEQMIEMFKQSIEQMKYDFEELKLQTQTQVDMEKAELQATTNLHIAEMDMEMRDKELSNQQLEQTQQID